MLDYALAGFRLVERRYGLVADLPLNTELTSPYYMILEFRKGTHVTHELFPFDNPNLPSVMLSALGKIVKHKETVPSKTIYTYTDGTWDSFGMD